MEAPVDAAAIRHNAPREHGIRVLRGVLQSARARHLPLRVLWERAVQLGNEVRVRYGMAEFLGADRGGKYRDRNRYRLWPGPHRSAMQKMLRAPGSRIRRRSATHASAILHELRGVEFQKRFLAGRVSGSPGTGTGGRGRQCTL